MSEGRRVRLEGQGGVGRIIIDHPPVNILDMRALSEMLGILRDAGQTRYRVFEITGEGERAFSSGLDIADHLPDRIGEALRLFREVLTALEAIEVPTVAVTRGMALGGGAELMLACDFALAADDLRFGFPEVRLGVFPPAAVARLPHIVGERMAWELVLTGEILGAPKALELGLVNRVYSAQDLRAGADKFITGLADLSSTALKAAKKAFRASKGLTPSRGLIAAEKIYMEDLAKAVDGFEGIKAFLEKRKPTWKQW